MRRLWGWLVTTVLLILSVLLWGALFYTALSAYLPLPFPTTR